MESIICVLCQESILLLGRTRHGAIVSHRKMQCSKMKELRLSVDREYLIREYIEKDRSALDISQELGFTSGTKFVDNQLKRFDIQKKSCEQQAQSERVLARRRKTSLAKYGVDNPSKSSEVIQKIKDNQPPVEIVGAKISAALKSKTPEEWKSIKEKAHKTFKDRYGIDNVASRPDVRQKMSMTRRGFSSDQVEEWKKDIEDRKTPQSLYSDDFHDRKFRTAIMQDQNWKCALCLKDRSKSRNVRFPLHHIDRNKANNERKNLIFLCCSCHGKVHGNKENFEMHKLVLEQLNLLILNNREGK